MSFISFGMKAVILNKFKPDTFLDSIEKYKPTKLFAVPPMVLFLTKSPLVDNYDISSVRDLVVGGAPLGKDLQVEASKRYNVIFIDRRAGIIGLFLNVLG